MINLNNLIITSSLAQFRSMTTGLEAIGKEFYSKVGVEEIFIAVGAVDFAMTENAGEAAPQAAVHDAMLGRNAVALQAGAVIGLG